MSRDAVDGFLAADTAERLRIVRARDGERELREFLGAEAWNEYRALAPRLDEKHLAINAPPNLLFVPGVMGSLIQSETKGGVWWIDARTRNHINDLGLSPSGREDANPDDQLRASNVDTSYEPFLTAALEQPDFGHSTFPYDWRKLLTLSARDIASHVSRLHDENGGRPVNLVGHSMGGLMIRAALMECGDELWPKIGRIVFVGTPHQGSPAIAGYLKNHLWGFDLMALLGLYLSRATFRSLWGCLAMLPAPRGIYPGTRAGDPDPWQPQHSDEYAHPCANFDLYRADSWHLDLNTGERAQLQRVLDGACDFHTRMAEAHTRMIHEQRDRMLVIAGVGYETLFRLEWASGFLGLWERAKKVTSRIERDPHREGDGRVPIASAELDDVRIRYVRGVHGGLPNIPAVYRGVFDFLRGDDMDLARTPEEALRRHLAPSHASEAPTLDGTSRAEPASDDPGVWEPAPDAAALAAMKDELEHGGLPAFQTVRLL